MIVYLIPKRFVFKWDCFVCKAILYQDIKFDNHGFVKSKLVVRNPFYGKRRLIQLFANDYGIPLRNGWKRFYLLGLYIPYRKCKR